MVLARKPTNLQRRMIVRMDRGQAVCTDGPYRYVGGLLLGLATPLILGRCGR